MAPHESNQASLDDNGHDEKYKAAQAELARAVELESNKANEIKAIRRKATQQNLRVEAKKAKIAKLSEELQSAQSELLNAQSEESQMRRDLQAAGAAHAELSLTREIKEAALETVDGKAPPCKENFDAATDNISIAMPEMKDTLSTWAKNFFQTSSACLFYPTANGIFLSTKGDIDKEASGMIQRINNPMYLTDRVVYFMTNKFADAKTRTGQSIATDDGGLYRRMWLMMDSQFDRLVDAPEQAILAVVLSKRLDAKALGIAQKAVGTPIPVMDARDKAAHKLINECKSARNEPVFADVTKLRKKMLETASMGRLFREIVEYYGRGILVVLPLAEFFNSAQKQRAERLPNETLQALGKLLLINQDTAKLRALDLIVALLNRWIDYSVWNYSVKAERVNEEKQFMLEMGQLREKLGLPAASITPFSQIIDIKPIDRWELLASVSGWDIAYNADLLVFRDEPDKSMTVNPQIILGDILGQRYTFSNGNFQVEHPTDIEPDTMKFLLRLLRIKTGEGVGCPMLVLDLRRNNDRISTLDMGKSREWIKATICVVRLDQGWGVIWVPKAEAERRPLSEVLVFIDDRKRNEAEETDDRAKRICVEEIGAEVASRLGLPSWTIKIAHVKAARTQSFASGTHALCHALALDNVGHHRVDGLPGQDIMEIRHAILRTATIAFIHAANAEKARAEEGRV